MKTATTTTTANCRLYTEPVIVLAEYLVDGITVCLVKTRCGREWVRRSQLEIEGEMNLPESLFHLKAN